MREPDFLELPTSSDVVLVNNGELSLVPPCRLPKHSPRGVRVRHVLLLTGTKELFQTRAEVADLALAMATERAMELDFGEGLVAASLGTKMELEFVLEATESATAKAVVAWGHARHGRGAQECEESGLADAPRDLEPRLFNWKRVLELHDA
jgi:hypothetical protein